MFPSSDVIFSGAAVSGFWMLLLLMDALKDGRAWMDGGTWEQFAKFPFMYNMS